MFLEIKGPPCPVAQALNYENLILFYLIWIRPEEITDGTLVRSLLNAIELADLIKCIDRGGETTVEAENLILDDGSERKVVE